MRARGVAIGQEYRGKGIHVHLGPSMYVPQPPTEVNSNISF